MVGEESPGDGVAFLQVFSLDVLDGPTTKIRREGGNRERGIGPYSGLRGGTLEPVTSCSAPVAGVTSADPSPAWPLALSHLRDPLAQHRFSSFEWLNLTVLFTCFVTLPALGLCFPFCEMG